MLTPFLVGAVQREADVEFRQKYWEKRFGEAHHLFCVKINFNCLISISGKFCGTGKLPGTLVSSDSRMWIQYKASRGSTHKGFVANYEGEFCRLRCLGRKCSCALQLHALNDRKLLCRASLVEVRLVSSSGKSIQFVFCANRVFVRLFLSSIFVQKKEQLASSAQRNHMSCMCLQVIVKT